MKVSSDARSSDALPGDALPADAASPSADDLIGRLRTRLDAAGPSEPLYARLSHGLAHEIAAGRLVSGERLPGERVLADGLALSRVTIRKAIDGLVEAGRLVRRPGAGTAVADRVEKSLTRLTGFSEELAARGLVPGCLWLVKRRAPADEAEAQALGQAPGAPILRLHRVRTADGVPIAWERAAVPASVIGDPDAVGPSLYAALEATDAAPVRAVQRLRAEAATEVDTRHLKCALGAPLLVMDRRCSDRDGRIVESTESRYLGSAYDFVTELLR